MKNVFYAFLLVLTGALLTGGYLIFERYQKNPEQIVPLPFYFVTEAPSLKLDAPILIVGDRMGAYFAKFKEELALHISSNLSKAIKIQSIAREGQAIHRTIHQLKALEQWPQIVIYQGGSEEMRESKFKPSEIPKIKENFERFKDDRIQTALILYPLVSRVIYEPIDRVAFTEVENSTGTPGPQEYSKLLETELLLYEQQLLQLVSMSKDRNSLLILTTTPVNLDSHPKEVCPFATTLEIDKEILDLADMLRANNPKNAYAKSSKLIQQIQGNAKLFYLHGQTARRLGLLDEARKALLQASAYDCEPWRATELQNSIIRKVARDQEVLLFDFARMVEADYASQPTFFDDLFAQNLSYEKGMLQLGLVIKSILKL